MSAVARNERLAAARKSRRLLQEEIIELLARHAQEEMTPPAPGWSVSIRAYQYWEGGQTPGPLGQRVLMSFFGMTAAQLGFEADPYTSATASPIVMPGRGSLGDVEDEDEVRRRQLNAGVVSFAGLPALGPLKLPVVPLVPKQISHALIEELRDCSITFSALGNARGGGAVHAAVITELEWSARLLHIPCAASLRPQLFHAVSRLAMTAGSAMFDACDHDNARTAFRFSVACAEEASDWSLRAKTYSCMARQAVWLLQPEQALTYVDLALARADRLTATEQAMLHTARARALAKLGRTQDTLRAVGHADDAFARSDPSGDPPWMTYYDHAQHMGDTAHALFDLEVLGARTEAGSRFAAAVAGHTDAYARSRAISLTKMASLVMATGDPAEAAVTGAQALQQIDHLRSRRALDDLHELGRYASRHTKDADAAELRERIAVAIGA